MEGMGGFSDAEFDLLGMLFPGNDPDGTSMSLSQYSNADDECLYAMNAGENTAGVDGDYSYCSLVNVDSSFPWNSGFYVPATDFSTIVNSERIRNEMVTDDTQVQTAESVPVKGHFVAGKGSKRGRKTVATGTSADTAVEISETPKKRPRQSRVMQKRQESVRTRRSKKSTDTVDKETDDDKNNGDGENQRREGQSPISSCSSEDDVVNSQQLSASDDLNLKASSAPNNNCASGVKPRAGRGAATDPQSLYARKRRERINERLKILQNLIPNGTKVDLSTMLEEAVHYVKFLQLQIKLLSSDEMWMYAPITYNGKDIGLNRLFSSQL